MTSRYDEMMVSPDPVQAEELRLRLHARMASIEEGYDESLAALPVDCSLLEPDVVVVAADTATTAGPPARSRTQRARLLIAAAAAVVVIAGIAVTTRIVDDRNRPVAFTTPIPAGEVIRVGPDAISLGDALVGARVAKEDGRTFVVADHFDGQRDPRDDRPILWWFQPKTAVLVAFDKHGVELWRTELNQPPSQLIAVAGDPWLSYADGTLARIDATSGRVADQMNVGEPFSMVGALGSVWVQTGSSPGRSRLLRVSPDLSTTSVKLPDRELRGDYSPTAVDPPEAGPDVIGVPLGDGGVALVDPATLEVTAITADEVGHEVKQVAFHDDAIFVANDFRVTAIVDGRSVATTLSSGDDAVAAYLGSIDDVFGFGELRPDALFRVLRPNDPMVVEPRRLSTEEQIGSVFEVDGETWIETGLNYDLHRVRVLPR